MPEQGVAGAGVDRAALRALSVRTDAAGLRRLGIHLGLLALTTSAVALARGTLWLVPAWIVDGLVLGHLFAAQHECAHRTAFRNPALNRWVGTAAGVLTAVAPEHFRHEHLAHHRFTRDRERDPELLELPASRLRYLAALSAIPYWVWTFRLYAIHAAGRLAPGEQAWIPEQARRKVFREARVLGVLYLVVLLVSPATGWWWPWTLWLVPRLLGEPMQRVIRLAEHTGRPHDPDPRVGTRSLRTLAPLRLLAWNMPLHAEHHALPSVPFHALPALHARLDGELTTGGGYLAAHRDIWRGLGAKQSR